MAVGFSLEGTDFEKQFRAQVTRNKRRVADAMRGAVNRAREEIDKEWDKDVDQAGNFSQRWKDALQFEINPRRGRTHRLSLTIKIVGIPYWRIHEYGGTIFPRNASGLLWIPLPWTGITKMWAGEYGRRYGLFRVDREGKNPLLFSMRDKEAKYVGVESVTLRKRFHLRRIIRRAAANMPRYYRSEYRKRKGVR